jgi:hypothetical protein
MGDAHNIFDNRIVFFFNCLHVFNLVFFNRSYVLKKYDYKSFSL